MVDGKSLVGLTHDEAVGVLKGTQKLVQLVVATEHITGDQSLNSSLQSIPEYMINLVSMLDRQGSTELHTANDSEPPIAPEALQSPYKVAFQEEKSEAIEMQSFTKEGERDVEQEETAFGERESVRVVEVTRAEGKPLGFSISSDARGIVVQSVDPKGAVANLLCEGDQLLEVNKVSLEMATRKEAHNILMVSFC